VNRDSKIVNYPVSS